MVDRDLDGADGARLTLDISLDRDTHAQLTTPGAAKWYRSAGAPATQTIAARVAAGATLEWLPYKDHHLYTGTGAHLCGFKIRNWADTFVHA